MSSRTTRYFGLFQTPQHMNAVLSRPIMVVGCGSIGRRLLLLLAQTGFTNLTFMDPDTVSEENYGPQGYNPGSLGQSKAEVMAEDLHDIYEDTDYTGDYQVRKVTKDDLLDAPGDTIFVNCTDSMECRAELAALCETHGLPLFDARMSITSFQILWLLKNSSKLAEFKRSLFLASEAEPTPCTLKASSWCASTCASVLLAVLFNYMTSETIPDDFIQGTLMPFPHIVETPNLH